MKLIQSWQKRTDLSRFRESAKQSRLALYVRVSSEKQSQEGSIESQLSSLKEHASQQGYSVDPDLIFADNGISGTTLVRPALDLLRDKANAGEIDRILILSPDRLARKYAHQLVLIDEFKRLGVEILFQNKNISESPEDQLLLQIQGVISEYEREKIIERGRRGKLQKAKAGIVNVLSGAPFGYNYIPASDEGNARYEINPQEAQAVRMIFHLFTRKKLSLGKIARELEKNGIRTRVRNKKWARSTLFGIVKNPAYMGQAAYGKRRFIPRDRPTKYAREHSYYPKQKNSSHRAQPPESWIKMPVPAIVDSRTYASAQAQLLENKKFSQRNNKKNQYLLTGLMHCKECGYAVNGRGVRGGTPWLYYGCTGSIHRWPQGRVCSSRPVRVEIIDELVWEQVKKLIQSPDLIISEYVNRMKKKTDRKASLDSVIRKKEHEKKSQGHEKQRLLDLYQAGELALPEIQDRLRQIRTKIKNTESEIELLQKEKTQESHKLHLLDELGRFRKTLQKNLDHLSFEKKKALVRLLVTQIVLDMNQASINVQHVIPEDFSSTLCPRGLCDEIAQERS